MLIKQIISLSFLSTISFFTLAESGNWIYPEPYSKEYGSLTNDDFFSISKTNDNKIIYILGKNKIKYPWITICFKGSIKGIPDTMCSIREFERDKEDDQIIVTITRDNKLVGFIPDNLVEINYKVDKKPIISLNGDNYFTSLNQKRILNNLINSSNLTYSYKQNKNSTYTTREVSLLGLKKHIEFAEKIIQSN